MAEENEKVVDARRGKADFTGTWLKTAAEGDTEALLKSIGKGFLKRKAARAFSFGVNKQRQIIVHDGDSFQIENRDLKTTKSTMIIGGGEQDGKDADGDPVKLLPEWETDQIMHVTTTLSSGHVIVLRRWLEEDGVTMRLEQVAGDIKCCAVFKKQ